MIEALSQQLLNQFSKNLAAQILSQDPQQTSAPLDAGKLVRQATWQSLRGLFGGKDDGGKEDQ